MLIMVFFDENWSDLQTYKTKPLCFWSILFISQIKTLTTQIPIKAKFSSQSQVLLWYLIC